MNISAERQSLGQLTCGSIGAQSMASNYTVRQSLHVVSERIVSKKRHRADAARYLERLQQINSSFRRVIIPVLIIVGGLSLGRAVDSDGNIECHWTRKHQYAICGKSSREKGVRT